MSLHARLNDIHLADSNRPANIGTTSAEAILKRPGDRADAARLGIRVSLVLPPVSAANAIAPISRTTRTAGIHRRQTGHEPAQCEQMTRRAIPLPRQQQGVQR